MLSQCLQGSIRYLPSLLFDSNSPLHRATMQHDNRPQSVQWWRKHEKHIHYSSYYLSCLVELLDWLYYLLYTFVSSSHTNTICHSCVNHSTIHLTPDAVGSTKSNPLKILALFLKSPASANSFLLVGFLVDTPLSKDFRSVFFFFFFPILFPSMLTFDSTLSGGNEERSLPPPPPAPPPPSSKVYYVLLC